MLERAFEDGELARDGLPGLISVHGLRVEIEKVVSAGNMHAYVARK